MATKKQESAIERRKRLLQRASVPEEIVATVASDADIVEPVNLGQDANKTGAPLTLQQLRLLNALPTAKTYKDAAISAGYEPNSASKAVSQLLGQRNIRAAVRNALMDNGISLDSMARKIRDGIEANQYGMTKDGDVVEIGPDYATRYKYLELVAKITGSMPDPRLDIGADGGNAIIIRTTQSLD
jgi:hypothetical protein